jgi:hypothetical protein
MRVFGAGSDTGQRLEPRCRSRSFNPSAPSEGGVPFALALRKRQQRRYSSSGSSSPPPPSDVERGGSIFMRGTKAARKRSILASIQACCPSRLSSSEDFHRPYIDLFVIASVLAILANPRDRQPPAGLLLFESKGQGMLLYRYKGQRQCVAFPCL